MLPKFIKLTYKTDVVRHPQMPLPTEISLRGCNQVVSTVEKEGVIKRIKVRSEYDGLYDLELDIVDVQNGKGLVDRATFKESL
jgi:hypothetical protein